MTNVLLTVSGTIDPAIEGKIARGERPRADYIELARGFDADLIDYARARREGGAVGKLIEKFGGCNALLAWVCWRKRGQYRVIFTDGEQVGIPLALLLKFLGRGQLKTRHLMLVHILSVGKKMLFFDKLKIHSHIDRFFVYSTWQKRFIEERWGVPDRRVIFTPFMVDDQFFSTECHSEPRSGEESPLNQPEALRRPAAQGDTPIICAVGLERRDYPTLMQAVRDLDVQVVIAAASPWSKQSDSTERAEVPANVTVKKFTQYELRQLYADSAFMVMPLYNVNFQAGVTAILEAMAMERAVICSRTPGQTDVIIDGANGLYVPPEDAATLRATIVSLLNNPAEAARLGRNGRKLIEQQMNLAHYVERLKKIVEDVTSNQ